MRPNSCEDLLNRPDKGQSEAFGTLSLLFRKILDEKRFDVSRLNTSVMAYLTDPRNGYIHNVKKISSERSNIHKEIMRPTMTWKVFRKLLKVLGVRHVKLTLDLDWGRGKPHSIHDVEIQILNEAQFPEYHDFPDDDDDDSNDS